MNPWASAQEAYAFLKSRSRFGIKPGLLRMQELLARLDHPERHLRFIHVAGTNGKGSTCAMISALFVGMRKGFRVGQYTSPDLGKLEERISINQALISEASFVEALFQVKLAMAKMPDDPELEPTEFEVLTAAALWYFAAQKVDLVVIETGLGGRYDATNVVMPDVTVITNVGLDHQEILGDTIAKIAYDKAGIIKPGIPVVTAARGDAIRVIDKVASEQGSPVFRLGHDFHVVREASHGLAEQIIDYVGIWQDGFGLHLPLTGDHQLENAGLALAAFELAKRKMSVTATGTFSSIRQAYWPGRFEVFDRDGVRVIVDGAHNEHAAKALAATLQSLEATSLELVFGAMADKNIEAVFEALQPFVRRVWLTKPDTPRAASSEELKRRLGPFIWQAVEVQWVASVEEAVKSAVHAASRIVGSSDPTVLVTGSLYTVAEARKYLLTKYNQERERGDHGY